MRKLSKLIAVAAAMVLLMAMSTGVFAATNGSPIEGSGATTASGKEGTIVGTPIAPNAEQEAAMKEDVKDQIAQELNKDVSVDDIVIVDRIDIEFVSGGVVEAVDEKITVTLPQGDWEVGDTIYIVHQMHDGTFEIVQATVNADGTITFSLNGLSPIWIAKIEQAKMAAAPEAKADDAGKVSPKTGF